jgi:beta-galactosidase
MIDEAFDMWHVAKNPDDYATHFAQDWEVPLTAMVKSARNSPCVIMWSIGNEIPSRSLPQGVEWSWKLANAVRRIDSTRPVTAAINGLLGPLVKASATTARAGHAGETDNAASVFLDVTGYNYRLADFERDFAAHPTRIAYGSETFPSEAWDYADLVKRAPYVLGEFVWTAMDYLGEAGIGATTLVSSTSGIPFGLGSWPWINAWCGDIDLIGEQKAPSRFRDVVWGLSQLEMAVQRPIPEGQREAISTWGWSDERQSWTWPGAEGRPLAVRVYTPGDRVEILLNGVKVGEAKLTPADKMRGEVKVPFAPGTLEAVAFSGGREIARRKLTTVGAPAKLRLRPESLTIAASRQGLAYIDIDVLDAAGRVVPDSEVEIALSLAGPATLAGFGSANPLAVGSFQAMHAKSFHGRALVILRGSGTKGPVTVMVQSPGLTATSITLRAANKR